ncbi:MAG: hypothetical protein HY873_09815 [Chloroflexi bacterium]|nr:hypothetical protein [Chloroflexota bacterium]
MNSAKEEVLSLLEILPDDMSMEELLQRIAFKARLLRSIEQADRGELIPNEQVMEELDQWLESLGHPSRAAISNK